MLTRRKILAIILSAALCLGFASCGGGPASKTVSAISAEMQTEYTVGDSFPGGSLHITYSDQSTATVDLTAEMLDGFDTATAGTRTVTVSYGGKTCTVTVTVRAAAQAVRSLSAEMPTEYQIGDPFPGGSLHITYEDQSTATVDLTAEMLAGFDTATAGTRTVTVSYGGKTCTVEITVSAQGVQIPTRENFDLGAALRDAGNWTGFTEQNPILDSVNGFLSFRQNSNNAVAYTEVGMSSGTIELQLKVSVSRDTTAAITFFNLSRDFGGFGYDAGSRMYALEFADDGGSVMYVKKWINGAGVRLNGALASSAVPLAVQARFTDVRIVTAPQADGALNIKVYVADSLKIDVTDERPLAGGAVGFSYIGTGGMAVGAPGANPGDYVEPPKPKLNIYDQPDVAVADSDVDLMTDFTRHWTGRADIYAPVVEDAGVTFRTAYNVEEPQNGVGEYQALYKDKIFADVQLEYRFNVISSGEWMMFWFRCVPQSTTNVSVWGNKLTGEKTNGYSMLIEPDGYVQVHKWADGAQTYLNGKGTQLNAETRALLKNAANEITLKMSIERLTMGVGEQAKDLNEFRIQIGTSDLIVVQDTDTPFLNAGYIGLQGYAINNGSTSIRLLSAQAKTELTL